MLMHTLISNRLTPLLYLIFKICWHKVLLNDYSFSFNNSVVLIGLLSISINFILVWIHVVVSGFVTLINFLILLIGNHVDIYRLLVSSSYVLVLTLIPGINPTNCINPSSTNGIHISFLILYQST